MLRSWGCRTTPRCLTHTVYLYTYPRLPSLLPSTRIRPPNISRFVAFSSEILSSDVTAQPWRERWQCLPYSLYSNLDCHLGWHLVGSGVQRRAQGNVYRQEHPTGACDRCSFQGHCLPIHRGELPVPAQQCLSQLSTEVPKPGLILPPLSHGPGHKGLLTWVSFQGLKVKSCNFDGYV